MILAALAAHPDNAALPDQSDDLEMLTAQAGLQVAMADFPAAAATYELIAAYWRRQQLAVAGEEAEAAAAAVEEVKQLADACQSGEASYLAARFATIESSLAGLRELRALFNTNDEEEGGDHLGEVTTAVANWRSSAIAASDEPSPETLAVLDKVAAEIAGMTVGLISFEPVQLIELRAGDFETPLSPWFAELAPALSAAGCTLTAHFDNPANTAAVGIQAQGQFWTVDGGYTAVVLETARNLRLRRIMSAFDDGSLLLTSDSRGSTYYSSGPRVDTFSLFRSASIKDMLAVHRARLRHRLADRPALRALPIDSVALLADIEDRMRRVKIDFRMTQGITDTEIRGMNAQHYPHYAARLKAKVWQRLDALRA